MPNEYSGALPNIARALIGQGTMMGWGDEAEAWLRSKIGDDSYEQLLPQIRQEYGKYAEEYPSITVPAEIAGGVLPGIGALAAAPVTAGASLPAAAATLRGALSPLARAVRAGAATGAVSGAGSADEDRLSGALTGGVIGGILGGAVPVVGRSIGAVTDYVRGMGGAPDVIERETGRRISRAAGEKGITGSDLLRKYAEEEIEGRPGILATQLPQLAETVAQRGGRGAQIMDDEMAKVLEGGGRYSSQRNRIFDRFKELSDKSFWDREQEMIAKLRREAGPAYKKAYEMGDIDDPVINEILQDKTFANLFKKAQELSDLDVSIAKARGEDPEPYKLKKLYETVLEEGKEPVEKVVTLPGVRELDYIKRGIDSKIDELYKSGAGQEATKLRDLRSALVDAVDKATETNGVSPYKLARSQYAGDMEMLDALRLGKENFKTMSKEELEKVYGKLSPAEKEAFRTGVVQNAYDMIMKPETNKNFAKRFLTPDMQEKLLPLFPSKQRFDVFKAALEKESDLFKEAGRILGGSQTASRKEMIDAFEARPEIIEALKAAVDGDPNRLPAMAARFATSASITDKVAERVAKLLTSSDPHDVAAAVATMEKFEQQATKGSEQLLRRETVGAGALGAASGQAPSPEGKIPGAKMTPDIYTAAGLKGEKKAQKTEGPSIWEAAGVEKSEDEEE